MKNLRFKQTYLFKKNKLIFRFLLSVKSQQKINNTISSKKKSTLSNIMSLKIRSAFLEHCVYARAVEVLAYACDFLNQAENKLFRGAGSKAVL